MATGTEISTVLSRIFIRVAPEKGLGRAPAFWREPLHRWPDARIVSMTVSSDTADGVAPNGRAEGGAQNSRVRTSTQVISAKAKAA
jgi:hypothetical protein